MVKISDKTDYSRIARPSDDDEGIWLDYVEVHLVTHPVGQVKEMHVHDPPLRPRRIPGTSPRGTVASDEAQWRWLTLTLIRGPPSFSAETKS